MQPALTATAFRAAAVVDGGQDVELFEDRGLAKGLEWPGNIWEHLGTSGKTGGTIIKYHEMVVSCEADGQGFNIDPVDPLISKKRLPVGLSPFAPASVVVDPGHAA
jgi:hypothetical protein